MPVRTRELVTVAPLRMRFLQLERRYGTTSADIARELGWTRKKNGRAQLDSPRVRRALGLTDRTRQGARVAQEYVSYDQAVRLARALDMDPFEAGV